MPPIKSPSPSRKQSRTPSRNASQTQTASPRESRLSLTEDLRQLLLAGEASTQEQLCAALAEAGHQVNQSKVSRLLHKLKAIKTKNQAGDQVYRLPLEPTPPPLLNLADLVIGMAANESLIIMRTSPGSAQLLARTLDHSRDELGILGTLAGDDTIFIAPQSVADLTRCMRRIQDLLRA